MGVSDNSRGLVLAMLSSLFIGTSFILKKKGLKRAAAACSATRAGLFPSFIPFFFFISFVRFNFSGRCPSGLVKFDLTFVF